MYFNISVAFTTVHLAHQLHENCSSLERVAPFKDAEYLIKAK